MSDHPDIEDSDVGCFVDESVTMTECVTEGVFSAGPAPSLIGLMLSGTLLTSLYLAGNGTVIVPAVITILLGGAMVPLLPAQFVSLAWTVLAVGVTAAVFSLWARFTSRGGF